MSEVIFLTFGELTPIGELTLIGELHPLWRPCPLHHLVDPPFAQEEPAYSILDYISLSLPLLSTWITADVQEAFYKAFQMELDMQLELMMKSLATRCSNANLCNHGLDLLILQAKMCRAQTEITLYTLALENTHTFDFSDQDSSSQGLARSLRSAGHIDNESDAQHPTKATAVQSRKPAAYWTKQEEESFLQFLSEQKSITGDGNFKTKTFNDASNHLKEKFPKQKGAEKTRSVCNSKWTNLKSAYTAVVEIKRASGFTWTDDHGLELLWRVKSAWAAFVKGRAAAKPFKNKGLPLL
ncbi:hypothetical protein DFJ58DRAFT_734961 [Suillus subalutaceus]|uniref:uncharacterized protein n=1 Tax=Suillus subalutaceus TaxID=48586 RepID=UPI001B8654A4|nr:uncharacterized protein DFJ58DRAFT_734961 [Suillus subalutaceus]KAG1836474.1 hypothetical protein DFJ58DRAFT_734961 [Suillus subalutaceus]